MKKIVLVLLTLTLFSSCRTNSQTPRYQEFISELNDEVVKKIEANSPFPLSESLISDFKYYSYFETFGNGGISVKYELLGENKKTIESKLSRYKLLKNESLKYIDSLHVYNYSNKNEVLSIQLPELGEGLGDLSTFDLTKKENAEIYLINSGTINNVYKKNSDSRCSYTSGVYYFKKQSALVYWFQFY